MNPVQFRFRPIAEFTITADEIDILCECAKAHYDARCRQAQEDFQLMQKLIVFDKNYRHELTFAHADLYSKVLEQGSLLYRNEPEKSKMAAQLRRAFGSICSEMNTLTPKAVDVFVDDDGVWRYFNLDKIKTTFMRMLRTADQGSEGDPGKQFKGYEAAKSYFRSALEDKMPKNQIEAKLNDAFSLYSAMT
jgi:hypothetical protein